MLKEVVINNIKIVHRIILVFITNNYNRVEKYVCNIPIFISIFCILNTYHIICSNNFVQVIKRIGLIGIRWHHLMTVRRVFIKKLINSTKFTTNKIINAWNVIFTKFSGQIFLSCYIIYYLHFWCSASAYKTKIIVYQNFFNFRFISKQVDEM